MTGAADVAPAPRGVDGRRVAVWLVGVGLVGCVLEFLLAPRVPVNPLWLVVLAGLAALATYTPLRVSDQTDFDASFVPQALTALMFGPAPAGVVGILAEIVRWRRERYRTFALATNLVGTLLPPMTLGWAFTSITPDSSAMYFIVVGGGTLLALGTNLMLVVPVISLFDRAPVRSFARHLPTLVVPAAIQAAFVTSCMALYVEVGTSAAVFGGFGIATSAYVLHLVIEARRSAERATRLAEARSQLVVEVQTAEERVRARVAGELHDDVIQALLAARQDLSDTIHGCSDRLQNAAETLDAAIGTLRRTAVDLHPAVRSQIGLRAALERTVDQLEQRAGPRHELLIAGDIPRSVEGTVYGLSRELLANASQHAEASLVLASIACGPKSITVTVEDNGRGLAVERRAEALTEGHLGLASWEYRLANRGGSLTISAAPERGTVVTAVIPRDDLAGVG